MNDRPVDPMSTAMYWIEFVIRHGGAPHLRTAALRLRWYEYFYLDILFYIALVATVTYLFLIKMSWLVVKGSENKGGKKCKKQ